MKYCLREHLLLLLFIGTVIKVVSNESSGSQLFIPSFKHKDPCDLLSTPYGYKQYCVPHKAGNGGSHPMPFAVLLVSRGPKDHFSDYCFCLTA